MPKKDSYHDLLKRDFNNLFDELDLKENQRSYLRGRWLDQVIWMEGKAGKARDRYYLLRLTTIIGGVIIPILISFNFAEEQRRLSETMRYVTITLGAIVATTSAIEEFFHYGERWRHYRRSVESLKTQGWQFSQLTGVYTPYKAHSDAFGLFVGQVEDIIQRDVEVYATTVARETIEEQSQEGNKVS
ncbi:DUF4231 domain-containing protein [Leptolyngbya sp. AN02str]|uniref:DUF4231 domain-containing protein n=1 Tax=Leptolyngbya sp. AN02str TaxID=3423363 RepID=UPI003D31642B